MAKTVRSVASALTGAVTAAGVIYYFDATSGRRRRAELSERSASTARRLLSRLRVAGRDLGNRAGGMASRAVNALRPSRLSPEVLAERVRACLGRVVSHPGAIHVSVEEPGVVLLTGAVLAWEHRPLVKAILMVSGVSRVRDELAVYESAEHVSALQGGVPRRGRRPELLQDRWSPGMRLLMAAAGGSLLVGSRRRGPLGALGTLAGGALLLRSVVNAPLRDIARGRGPRLEVRKSLHVRAPVERVFTTLQNCEDFPTFMRHFTQVRRNADGSTQWVMNGPWGMPIEWEAVTTQMEPNRLLAWRTTERSPLQHWGMLRFEPADPGETRVHVYLSYQAPAGRLGQAVARVFGADPRSGLVEELQRLKNYLERGVASGDGARRPNSQATAPEGSAGPGAAGVAEAGTGGADLSEDWSAAARGRPH
jgi:uncharacterized membrane protein